MKTKNRSLRSTLTYMSALILIAAMIFALASCGLIRKATEIPEQPDEGRPAETVDTSADDTDAAETEDPAPAKDGLRYTEDEAYDVLIHSIPDYDKKKVKIERTGNIIAEENGTEYYIFNVSLPITPETEKPESTDETDETETTEAPEVKMGEPEPYYVSVNGVVHREISGDNVDTDYVKAAFFKNYGERDSATGFAYSLEYEGLVKNKGMLCYSFAVFETDTSGADPVDKYVFNYIVTTDGKLSAEASLDH